MTEKQLAKLVTREGKRVTVKFVLDSYNALILAALRLKDEYYNPTHGWDTRDHWFAFMLIYINAAMLLDPDNPEVTNLPPSIDPIGDKNWKEDFGRTQRMKDQLKTTALKNAFVLSAIPVMA